MVTEWLSNEERARGCKNARKLADEALPCVAGLLGKFHGVDSSPIFWEPIVGVWLRHFAVVYVDRMEEHASSLKQERDLSKLNVPKENWLPPLDWSDFYVKHGTPGFHDQLSSQIEYFENYNEALRSNTSMRDRSDSRSKVGTPLENRRTRRKTSSKSFRSILIMFSPGKVLSILWNFSFAVSRTILFFVSAVLYRDKLIVIASQFLDRKSIIKFIFLSSGQIAYYPTILSSKAFKYFLRFFSLTRESDQRAELLKQAAEIKGADQVFWNVLIQQIPRVHVEGFQEVYRLSKFTLVKSPVCVYADGQQHIDEILKVSMGRWRLNGTKLLMGQHGGNWPAASWDSLFDQDLAIASTCYTWGWNNENESLRPMPSIRLSLAEIRHNQFKYDTSQRKILYICRTTFSNQQGTFDYTLGDVRAIKAGRKKLADTLSESLRKDFMIRPRSSDLLGNNSNTVKEFEDAGFQITPPGSQISALFAESKVVIFEGLSTGFFECLAIDKPTVLFLSENYYPFENSSARELLALLEQFGIVFSDVPALSRFLEEDITEWWHAESRKSFRKELSHRFALTSYNFIHEWIGELRACSAS